jgi:hypothetical protein
VSGALLGLLALVGALAAFAHYQRLVTRVQVPLRPRAHQAAMLAAAGLAALALARDPGWLGGFAAAAALAAATLFLLLTSISGLPRQAPAVALGQPAPDFAAVDASGRPFSLGALRGHPVLLKFFRGHW